MHVWSIVKHNVGFESDSSSSLEAKPPVKCSNEFLSTSLDIRTKPNRLVAYMTAPFMVVSLWYFFFFFIITTKEDFANG
jgi:hypothetical protein